MKTKEHQENGETRRVSGTKNLEKGVSPSPVSNMSPSVNPAYRHVPSKTVHTK
jgi:hypothetical protein